MHKHHTKLGTYEYGKKLVSSLQLRPGVLVSTTACADIIGVSPRTLRDHKDAIVQHFDNVCYVPRKGFSWSPHKHAGKEHTIHNFGLMKRQAAVA